MSSEVPTTASLSIAKTVKPVDPYINQTLDFLQAVFANYNRSDYAFRLWDGTMWQKDGQHSPSPQFTITLNHPASLRRMFFPPSDSRLGEAYMLGDFDINGQMGQALDLGKHLWRTWSWKDTFRFAYKLISLPSSPIPTASYSPQLQGEVHSEERDMKAIEYHYDVSNEFYKLWLDKEMVYSCAYFEDPDESIDVAQLRKLDYICKKLRLQPGERLLDIGCGWGALVIHAVKNYGVTALGVTLSEKQYTLANERIKQAGLQASCKVEVVDYRHVDESQPFDKIVSIGMIEHVGRENISVYFDKAYRLLKPGGVFLNHGITLLHEEFMSKRRVKNGFFAKYIFPDGDLQPLVYILQFAANSKFEIRDVESLREHYHLTLNCWRLRLEKHEKEIVDMMGRECYRLWRLYLLGAGWGFDNGIHSIYQTLLYKSNVSGSVRDDLPLNRKDWYQ